jgi:hypothetical protein
VSFWTPDGQKIDFRCSDYARISTMERLDADIRAIPRLIFFASFACLSYEIALMRVFSISLWYHFAFMVISIAMLGIGASGTVLSLFPELRDLRRVSFYVFLLAIGIPLSYLLANSVPFDPAQLSWDHMQIFNVGLYYIILCVPFFCFGMIVSAAYTNLPQHASAMYAADLLGAGLGALAMVPLLSLGSPELSVFFISTLLFTGLLYEKDRKIRIFSLLADHNREKASEKMIIARRRVLFTWRFTSQVISFLAFMDRQRLFAFMFLDLLNIFNISDYHGLLS